MKKQKIEHFAKRLILMRWRVILIITVAMTFWGCCECCEDGEDGPPGPPGPSPVIIVPDDKETIAAAIDSLPEEGGTIYIKADTYELSQGIHINRSNVTMIGEQGTLIKLGDHINQPVFLIGTDEEIPTGRIENIKLSNIEIDGNKDIQDSETDPNRPWIRNNGIDIRMVDDLRISEVDVHDARSGGVVVSWDSRQIFIDGSSFYNNFFDGIALYDSEDIQVSNFFCYNNSAAGLSLDNQLKDTLFSNGSITNNGDVGIFARNSQDLNFHSLMIADNQSHGCFLSHETVGTNTGVSRLFFDSCSFLDNIGYGFWLASPETESPNNAVVGCLFSGNTEGTINLDTDGILYQEANVFQ